MRAFVCAFSVSFAFSVSLCLSFFTSLSHSLCAPLSVFLRLSISHSAIPSTPVSQSDDNLETESLSAQRETRFFIFTPPLPSSSSSSFRHTTQLGTYSPSLLSLHPQPHSCFKRSCSRKKRRKRKHMTFEISLRVLVVTHANGAPPDSSRVRCCSWKRMSAEEEQALVAGSWSSRKKSDVIKPFSCGLEVQRIGAWLIKFLMRGEHG